jgi:DNA-binding NtrC family response regulator
VSQSPAPKTVWIVDDDLGFVWWLGEIFTEAGCRALPALSCEQAVSLLKKLNVAMDLLVVNPQLPGVSGMLQNLTRAKGTFKIVAIGTTSPALTAAINPQAILERPSGFDSISRPDWLKKVRKLLKEVAAAAAG